MSALVVADRNERGVSLIEMLIAMCLTAILASIAVVQIGASRPMLAADGGMRAVMSIMNAARETAVAQRRDVQIFFVGSNVIRLERINLPVGTPSTVLRELTLESGVQFHMVSPSTDTPDAFGNGGAIAFGSATAYKFSSDGMLMDLSGNPLNGTVFLALPNQNQTFRAVTILGTTGRVRGYKWTGTGWTRV